MSKTYRISFEKGVNLVGDKAILPDGFATVLDNVDLRSGTPRPVKAPKWILTAPATATRSWSYRGRWFHSDNWQDHVGEFIGGIERVYTTEEGKYPTKTVGGVTALLGTARPLVPLAVAKSSDLSPSGTFASVSYSGNGNLPDGERLYRISARTKDGIMPPTAPVSVTVADTTHAGASVNLTWGSIPKATGYIIFEGTQTVQYRLTEVPASTLSFEDTGSITSSGDNADQFLQNQPFTYAYSYLRNVNGVFNESGLSTPSIETTAAQGRIITRDFANDGFFSVTDSSGVETAVIGTGNIPIVSATSYLAVPLSGVAVAYNLFTGTTKFAKTSHGFITGDRGYFSGMKDPVWDKQTYDIIYIDANNFAVSGANIPTDGTNPTPTTAGSFTVGSTYSITSVGTTDFTLIGAISNTVGIVFTATGVGAGTGTATLYGVKVLPTGAQVQPVKSNVTYTVTDTAAGSFAAGNTYTIASVGTTDFTLIGASSNTIGIVFTATGRGTGSGTATFTNPPGKPYPINTDDMVYLAGSGTGQVVAGFYKATAISPTSFSVPLLTTTAITLTTVKWCPLNNHYWRWRIYRNENGIWNLVDEVTLDKITYTDAKPFSALGETPTSFYSENMQDVDFDRPPLGLQRIESHYGMLFGISGHSVRWTPILQPDAWPETFSVTLGYQPVALASFAQGLIILCEDAIYRLDGNTATGMSLSKSYAEDGCFAPYSVQKTDKGLIYLSRRGIMVFDGSRSECLTDTRLKGTTLTAPSRLATAYPFWWMPTIMTRNYADMAGEDSIKGDQYNFTLDNTRTIEGYNKYIKSFYHLGKYYLFYSGADYAANTAFVLDMQVPGIPITTLGMKALDAHVDEYENAYVLFDNSALTTLIQIYEPTSPSTVVTKQLIIDAGTSANTGMTNQPTRFGGLFTEFNGNYVSVLDKGSGVAGVEAFNATSPGSTGVGQATPGTGGFTSIIYDAGKIITPDIIDFSGDTIYVQASLAFFWVSNDGINWVQNGQRNRYLSTSGENSSAVQCPYNGGWYDDTGGVTGDISYIGYTLKKSGRFHRVDFYWNIHNNSMNFNGIRFIKVINGTTYYQ